MSANLRRSGIGPVSVEINAGSLAGRRQVRPNSPLAAAARALLIQPVDRIDEPGAVQLGFPLAQFVEVGEYSWAVFFEEAEQHNQSNAGGDAKYPPRPDLSNRLLRVPHHSE